MSDAYVGEIELFAFGFAPRGWLPCDGSVLPISVPYVPLFAVIGNAFGGDGSSNFALPDLRGRTAVGDGRAYQQGQVIGEATHILTAHEIPTGSHAHAVNVSTTPAEPKTGATPAAG